jgi:hypothetical protein
MSGEPISAGVSSVGRTEMPGLKEGSSSVCSWRQQLYAGDAARLHQFETEIIAAVRIEGLAGLQIGDDADDGLPRPSEKVR